MPKYDYILRIKYTEAILSNSTRKLLRFEITKMLIAACNNKFIVLFSIIFGTLSFPISMERSGRTPRTHTVTVSSENIRFPFILLFWFRVVD